MIKRDIIERFGPPQNKLIIKFVDSSFMEISLVDQAIQGLSEP